MTQGAAIRAAVRAGARRQGERHNTQHGRGCAATQPGQTCDTARPGLQHSVVHAQAGLRLGTLCTRLSFDSVHCSESQFGTLFMNTVHERCSRGLKKMK